MVRPQRARTLYLAEQVGQAEPVLVPQNGLVHQRGPRPEQRRGRGSPCLVVALGINRSDGVEPGHVDLFEVAATLRGELFPRVRGPALRARHMQIKGGEVRTLHVGVDVGAGDSPHVGTISRAKSRP